MGWLQDVPPVPLAFLVLLTAMCLTKVALNTPTCSVLLPDEIVLKAFNHLIALIPQVRLVR